MPLCNRHWWYVVCVTYVLCACIAAAAPAGSALVILGMLTWHLFCLPTVWPGFHVTVAVFQTEVQFCFILTLDCEETSLQCWFLKELWARRYYCMESWRLETGWTDRWSAVISRWVAPFDSTHTLSAKTTHKSFAIHFHLPVLGTTTNNVFRFQSVAVSHLCHAVRCWRGRQLCLFNTAITAAVCRYVFGDVLPCLALLSVGPVSFSLDICTKP